MRRGVRIAAIGVGMALALAWTASADARQMDSFRLRMGERFEKTYGPIPGMTPNVFDPTLEECKASLACDVIDLQLAPDRAAGHKTTIEIVWPDPTHSNDLDLWMYDANGDLVDRAATSANPERVKLVDLPAATYHLAIWNWAGQNAGYTLRAELVTIPLPDPRPAAPAPPVRKADPPVARVAARPAPEPAPVAAAPLIPAEQVTVPGADGPGAEFGLQTLASARQAQPIRPSRLPLAAAVVVFVAAAGSVLVAVRIRRELATVRPS